MVQWLGLCASTAEGLGLIPDLGTKIPQVLEPCTTAIEPCAVMHDTMEILHAETKA